MSTNNASDKVDTDLPPTKIYSDKNALHKAISAHLDVASKLYMAAANYGENDDYAQSQERLVTAQKHLKLAVDLVDKK